MPDDCSEYRREGLRPRFKGARYAVIYDRRQLVTDRTLEDSSEPKSSRVNGLPPTWSMSRIRSAIAQGLFIGVVIYWAIALALALDPLWRAMALLPSAVFSAVLASRWHKPRGPLLAWSLIIGTFTAILGSWLTISPFSAGGLLIAGAAALPLLPKYRVGAGITLVFTASAISMLSAANDTGEAAVYGLVSVVFGTFWTCMFSISWWTIRVATELEEAHRAHTQLSVYQERYRIAADLHDIQGHTLHLVKLKTTLARKLMRESVDAAESELHEISQMVTDTIAQGQLLAYGQRQLSLPGELANAKNLLEAAGAKVTIKNHADFLSTHEDLASLLLRETTTNILRHTEATKVEISVDRNDISIINDGAELEVRELRGLETLRLRAADAGAELSVHTHNSWFCTKLRTVAERERSQE